MSVDASVLFGAGWLAAKLWIYLFEHANVDMIK